MEVQRAGVGPLDGTGVPVVVAGQQMPSGQPLVAGARCSPGAVAVQNWKRHVDLLGQPSDQGIGGVQCRRASLGPGGAEARCGSPTRGDSPGVGAYRSDQGPQWPEGSCAPAKRCRRGARGELRGSVPVQDVVKTWACLEKAVSDFETVYNKSCSPTGALLEPYWSPIGKTRGRVSFRLRHHR